MYVISVVRTVVIILGEEKKTKISKKMTFPFMRIIHSGEGWRDARIIPFDEKNVLKDVSEFADLARFEARYYDRKRAGWVRLKEDSTFSSFMDELKSDDPPRGLEVKLFDTSVIEKVPTPLVDGFFGIGIFRGKTEANHGTLWRSAYQFGASFIFTIGARFDKKKTRATDTVKAWTKIMFHFDTVEAFASSTPYAAPVLL